MSTLQERLSLAMAGPPPITAADLARATGVKPSSVSEWVNGPTKALRGDNLINAAKCLGVNNTWLGTGRGPMRSDYGAAEPVARYEIQPSHVRFPLLEGFAGMGRGDYVGDYPEIVDYVEVTREWAAQRLRGVPSEAVRVITGRGDSMRWQYSDGDLVFVDSRVKQFVGDSAYCYRWNGVVQIKRLQLIGHGRVRIISKNSDYLPIDVAIEDLEIGGRALAAWTLTEF